MADKAEFLQAIDDAILDADSLEKFINGSDSETVLTRLSAQYPTIKKALKELFESGSIAGRFETLVELQASPLVDGDYAIVSDDVDKNNGIYIKKSGAWAKSAYDTNEVVMKILIKYLGLKNLFTGEYRRILITGENDDKLQLGFPIVSQLTPSSAVLAVKPNTTYIVVNETMTETFRVGLFKNKITDTAPGATKSRLIARDNPIKGSVQFTTKSDETLLVVTIATTQPNDAAPLGIYELGGVNKWLEQGKNLMPPVYEFGWGLQPNLTNPELGIAKFEPFDKSVVMRCNVKPNTLYTLSKGTSVRFTVFEVISKIVNNQYMLRTRQIVTSPSDTQVTFTTSADAFMLKVYLSYSGETPFVQLEEGGQRTAWEEYGLRPIGFAKPYSSDSNSIDNGSVFLKLNPSDPQLTTKFLSTVSNASGKTLYINTGTYVLNRPVLIPSDVRIVGVGDVVIKMADDMTFTSDEYIDWRGYSIKSILRSAPDSKNITLENLSVKGANKKDYNYMHWGIALQGSDHVLRDVNVTDINFIADNAFDRRAGGDGWCLTLFKASKCKVYGGRFERGGYENIGTEESEDLLFDGLFLGAGWRTSIQFHRATKKARIVNSVIKQIRVSEGRTHAALTMHGKPDMIIEDIVIANNIIDSDVSETLLSQSPTKKYGAIQTVEGHEHNVTIVNNTIRTNKDGITSNSEGLGMPRNWVISNNRIDAGRHSIFVGGGVNGVISSNIIKAAHDISLNPPPFPEGISSFDNNYIVTDNLFVNK